MARCRTTSSPSPRFPLITKTFPGRGASTFGAEEAGEAMLGSAKDRNVGVNGHLPSRCPGRTIAGFHNNNWRHRNNSLERFGVVRSSAGWFSVGRFSDVVSSSPTIHGHPHHLRIMPGRPLFVSHFSGYRLGVVTSVSSLSYHKQRARCESRPVHMLCMLFGRLRISN